MSSLAHFSQVKAFLFDVDGVFTNNEVQITEAGELLRTIHLRDSFALKMALREGFPIGIITGGTSLGITKRLNELGIEFVAVGKHHKVPSLHEFAQKYALDYNNILYNQSTASIAKITSEGFALFFRDSDTEPVQFARVCWIHHRTWIDR